MHFAVTARAALTPAGVLDAPVLLVRDGQVQTLGGVDSTAIPDGWPVHAHPDAVMSPLYLDVHVHGSAGHDVMDDSRSGEQAMAAFLACHGVGRFLPTTVTAEVDSTLRALERLAAWIERAPQPGAAQPVGIHLEGPFLCAERRGVQPAEFIRAPDVALFDRLQQAARGHIRLLTLAAEQPGGMDLLRHCTAAGVRVSLGHSDATATQAQQAIAAGAASATHTFNAMRPLTHREPGLTGAVLAADGLYSELIADGHHVAPEVVRIWARAKPAERRILVTDAISATGQGDGSFRLGPLQVQVSGGICRYDGKLAGSVLTLDRAVASLADWARLPLEQAAAAAAVNPAAMLGVPAGLRTGDSADFLLLSASGVQQVWMNGKPVRQSVR